MQSAYVSAQSYEKYAYPTPYFTNFLLLERLILHFLRLQNALFYKFLAFRTPYFTVFASPELLILQISRLPNALFYSFCEFPDGLSAHYRAIWLS